MCSLFKLFKFLWIFYFALLEDSSLAGSVTHVKHLL